MKKMSVINERAVNSMATFAALLRESKRKCIRLFYPLLNIIYDKCAHAKAYGVVSHPEYSMDNQSVQRKVLYGHRSGYSSNLIYNASEEKQKLIQLPMEDVVLYHYKKLCICGDSDLIIDDGCNTVINDICFNKDVWIKYHDCVMLAQHKNTVLLRHKGNVKELESGIIMSGLFSKNYYHSLYDNLVRIMALSEANIPKDVPYMIDRATMEIPSLKRAFDCLSKTSLRDVIVLEPRQSYRVNIMYYITHVNHMIPSIESYSLCRPDDTVFDIKLTMAMREQLLSIKSDKTFPEKFFISRKHTSRRNFNEDEVFFVLQKEGFERVYPEDLSFEEQIALFNNAKVIVGGGGAAMTNLMFCNNGCKVLIINKTMDQVPCFTTIPYAIGVTIRHYGQENKDKRLHSDYVVNPQEVYNCLKILLSDDRDSNNPQT